MPYTSQFVHHILCESPFISGIFTPYDPSFMAYFGSISFANFGGWGWVKLVFKNERAEREAQQTPSVGNPFARHRGHLGPSHERKKHPKKICIKNFGGTLAGGSRRGLRRPNSLCRCWFSQQNTVHKEFRGGGGSKGVLGVGSKVQFWGPISLCLCLRLQSPYTGVSTPPTPEIPKKSQKGVPGPPGPECQESVEKVPAHPFWSLFDSFSSHLGLFRHFFDTPGREARERLFETFWGFRGSGVWRLLYMAAGHASLCAFLGLDLRARRRKKSPKTSFQRVLGPGPKKSETDCPVSPNPLNVRGADSSPKFKGVALKNTLRQGVLDPPPPKFRG